MNPLRQLGAPALMLLRTARATAREGLSLRECLNQIHELGLRSTWLVVSGMAFFGAVLITIANGQARRFTGNLVILGPAYFELMIREFGPVVSALCDAPARAAVSSAETTGPNSRTISSK